MSWDETQARRLRPGGARKARRHVEDGKLRVAHVRVSPARFRVAAPVASIALASRHVGTRSLSARELTRPHTLLYTLAEDRATRRTRTRTCFSREANWRLHWSKLAFRGNAGAMGATPYCYPCRRLVGARGTAGAQLIRRTHTKTRACASVCAHCTRLHRGARRPPRPSTTVPSTTREMCARKIAASPRLAAFAGFSYFRGGPAVPGRGTSCHVYPIHRAITCLRYDIALSYPLRIENVNIAVRRRICNNYDIYGNIYGRILCDWRSM